MFRCNKALNNRASGYRRVVGLSFGLFGWWRRVSWFAGSAT